MQLNSDTIKTLATAFKNYFTTLQNKRVNNVSQLQKFLKESFKDPEVAPALAQALYERFKPYKLDGYKEDTHVVSDTGMDVLDLLLALNLLARIVYDKKLKLLFELCDDDDDGCMTPEDILNMLQRVERVFAQECARVDFDSTILNNFVADKKAESNFHFIMGMIKHQTEKKQLRLKAQSEKAKEKGGKKRSDKLDDVHQEENEDNLITYREFINAIKAQALRDLYKRILPRTLGFKDVLMCHRQETMY